MPEWVFNLLTILATFGVAFLGGLGGWVLSIQTRTARLETAIDDMKGDGGPLQQGVKAYGIASRVGRELDEVRDRVKHIESNCVNRTQAYAATQERLDLVSQLLAEVRADVKRLLENSGMM